jgi:hypothetical protein
LRPLTKNGSNGMYIKYYPSLPFLPSVALGTLLTLNSVVGDTVFVYYPWVFSFAMHHYHTTLSLN